MANVSGSAHLLNRRYRVAYAQSPGQPDGGGGKDVFVHISAVEKAGITTLAEGAKVSYDIVANRGKESAEILRLPAGR